MKMKFESTCPVCLRPKADREIVEDGKRKAHASLLTELVEALANTDLAADEPIGDTGDSLLNLVWITDPKRWEAALKSLLEGGGE